MRPPDLETWFRDWRDRHDGEALARVFDASAAKLLLIAQHLTRDASAAEDLVQTTFLVAIESASQWDERQPLFPWLAGILANRARMQRRQARDLPEPRSLRERACEDPSEAAAAHEIDAALMAAIEALPATYRDVLVLRLVHGLAGVEIAHALSRSPETVRTQLHRGLERLRQALPKGILTPAILALLASDGLAAVRARVLAAALPPAAPAVLAVAGTLTMKKLALVILPLAMLGTWWALGPGGLSGSPASGPVVAAGAAAATSKPSSEEHSDSTPERVAVPAEPGEARALLRGRCVAAESGRGMPGAEILFQGYGRTKEDRTGHPDIHQRIRSGADGSFELAFDPPPGHCFLIRVLAAQRATVGASWQSWRKDATLDLGDVLLPLGTRLSGRVVDQQGNPIGGSHLALSGINKKLPCGNQPGDEVHYSGPTKADGSFAYEDPLPSGTIRLRVGDGYEQLEDCVLELLAGERARDVTITVRTPDPNAVLAGTVVDVTGMPIAGVTVEARGRDQAAARPVSTDSVGAFLLRCNGNTTEPARLSWSTDDARSDPDRSPNVRWGTRGIRLVVPRPLALEQGRIVVVDARTKEPVEEFGVLGFLEPAQLANSRDRDTVDERCRRHERGEMQLSRSARRPQNLLVLPKDPAYAPSDPVSFDPARQGSVPLRIELDRPALLRVRVRAADGTAIAGTRIEAWRWLFTTQDAPWNGATVPEQLPEYRNGLQGAYRLAEAATDATGAATLAVTRNLQNLLVQAVGPGHVRLARGGIASGADSSDLELVVERGATITGKVLPLGLVPRLDTSEPAPEVKPNDPTIPAPRGGMPANRRPGLSLGRLVEGGTRYFRLPTTPEPFPLADDGRFRIENIPPGTWSVCLFTFHLGTYGPEQPPLATVALAEGSSQELTLDARQLLPCAISGHVLLDGKPLAGAGLTLFRSSPGGDDELPSTDDVNPTSEDGAFAQPHANAGVHRLRVFVVDPLGRYETTYFSDDMLTIAPGESKTWEVRLQTRRLELRILGAEGKALPSTGVRIVSIATLFTKLLTTDPTGLAILEPAPPTDLAITMRTPNIPDDEFWRLPPAEQAKRTVSLGTHRIRLDRSVTQLELRLPAGVR